MPTISSFFYQLWNHNVFFFKSLLLNPSYGLKPCPRIGNCAKQKKKVRLIATAFDNCTPKMLYISTYLQTCCNTAAYACYFMTSYSNDLNKWLFVSNIWKFYKGQLLPSSSSEKIKTTQLPNSVAYFFLSSSSWKSQRLAIKLCKMRFFMNALLFSLETNKKKKYLAAFCYCHIQYNKT